MSAAAEEPSSPLKLGAFIGVFAPSILTILGVIMFLRTGWVVGNAGLGGAIVIVAFANLITLLTALSMSAMATNMKVGVGGAYYIISRSLGLEVGGAIGIPLYLSQVLSVTLYAYGLAEAIRNTLWAGLPVMPTAAVIVVFVTLVADKSTELALKLQLPLMGFIFAAILSLFLGASWGGGLQVPVVGGFEDGGFWATFAIFFPAVTGILAGVSLSGDLADPGKAIPWGTLGAVVVGFVVYLLVPVALGSSLDATTLRDPEVLPWNEIAILPILVVPGMFGAILSSAFGSILGAPRTLQALANDRLMPSTLGRVDDTSGEPMLALRISGGVALVAVLLGDLNAVAEWVTIFFLTTYGALNLVAGLESLVRDPSFRPRIKVPWWASFLGAAGCLFAMFLINPLALTVAIVLEIGLFWILRQRSLRTTWGTVRGGLLMAAARFLLLRLRESGVDSRNWRPHILVFSSDVVADVSRVRLAALFSQGRGIVTVSTLVVGDIEDHEHACAGVHAAQQILDDEGILAFCEVEAVPDLHAGVVTVAQANGFAGLASNTVMLGWPDGRPERLAQLLGITRRLDTLGKSVLISRPAPQLTRTKDPRIIVWWKGRQHNGDLMLLLAHLLCSAEGWRSARVVLKSVAEDAAAAKELRHEFADMLEDVRIDAHVDVVVRPEGEPFTQVIRRHSQQADLVFLGMGVAEPGSEADYAETMAALAEGLPSTVFVRNGGPFRGRLV